MYPRIKSLLLVVIPVIFCSLIAVLHAQPDTATSPPARTDSSAITFQSIGNDEDLHEKIASEYGVRFLTEYGFTLSVAVLAFGFLTILVEAALLWKGVMKPNDSIRTIVVTAIITGALFLIAGGYQNEQIAPVMGLLGTIAGYLLGRSSHSGDL